MKQKFAMTLRASAVVMLVCGAMLAQDGVDRSIARTDGNSARGALAAARDLLEAAKGTKDDERERALRTALEGFRAVVTQHGDDAVSCARAWFEIGDIQRRLLELEDAEQAYARAVELDPDRFGARGLFEQAQVQRRLDRLDDALASYRKVIAADPESARAHTARVRVGSCLEDMDDLDGATQAYRQALDETSKPARVIELCNNLARLLIKRGDLDGAAGIIARADSAVPAGEEGASARKKAEAMSARRALQRARDKQNGAQQDARQFEEDRSSGG